MSMVKISLCVVECCLSMHGRDLSVCGRDLSVYAW